MKFLAAVGIVALMLVESAGAVVITGVAEVTRPYAFNLSGYEVYLLGVDSVEIRQVCTIAREPWECGPPAQRQLETILSEGELTCDTVVGPDEAQRVIAECSVSGQDVGRRFIESGFGVAIPGETSRYDEVQAEARAAERGLWQGTFTPPAIWRSRPFAPRSNRPDFVPTRPVD
jgi:endonuclease YncB( thermonuclease family)